MTRGNMGLYESFWGNTVPATIDTQNTLLAPVAMRYQLTTAGSIFGMRYPREKRTFGAVIGVLWDPVAKVPVRSCVFRTKAASGTGFDRWEVAYFHPKYKVAANQQVIVAISYFSGRLLLTGGGLVAASITHGHIIALKDNLAGNRNGTLEGDTVTFPITSTGGNLFGSDIVFGPGM